MNLRIQTWGVSSGSTVRIADTDLHADEDGMDVYQILRKGLDDLTDLCDVVEDKFTAARDEFNKQYPSREKS